MNISTLLLRLDDGPLCKARTQFTLEFARLFDSHIVGLAATGFPELPVAVEGAISLVEYAEVAWRSARQRAARVVEKFRTACVEASTSSFSSIVDEVAAARSIVQHANCADLVILSQPDPKAAGYALERQIAEEVILYGSRPTLLLPYAGRPEPKIGNVMIAWDDSREVARAVTDALPILRRAEEIRLVSWNEAGDDAEATRARLQAVCGWLGRHGIGATGSSEGTPDVGIGDAVLSRAADLGADLIVMGAYGHARWTERVLGGATRGLLHTMTVPVLMSH